MNKILKILMISLLVASTSLLQASSAARTGTFAAGDITTELNSGPIVKSGSTNISYQHDPIAEGKSAFQGDIVDATPSGAKFLYAGGISTCQIIIVRDTKSGRTKFVYADQFFKPQSCAKLLTDFRNDTDSSDSDKTESTLSVRIVVNQKFFNDTSIAGDFSGVYGCSIDGRLEQLSNAFRSSGVNSEIIRLSSSTDLAATFRKYLSHDKEYVGMPDLMLNPLFKRLSDDVTASVCVNVATGELSWWSVPLTRVYAANPGKVMEYYSTRNEKQRLWMQMPGAHYGKGRQQQVILEAFMAMFANAKNTTSSAKQDTSSK